MHDIGKPPYQKDGTLESSWGRWKEQKGQKGCKHRPRREKEHATPYFAQTLRTLAQETCQRTMIGPGRSRTASNKATFYIAREMSSGAIFQEHCRTCLPHKRSSTLSSSRLLHRISLVLVGANFCFVPIRTYVVACRSPEEAKHQSSPPGLGGL